MPELPEVETTARGLRRNIVGRKIVDIWTDWPKYFQFPKTVKAFKKRVLGKKIIGVRRRGKNVLIELSGGYLLLIHQKMTGHLLVGTWKLEDGKWESTNKSGLMTDPKNGFIRLILFLDKNKKTKDTMIALSDLRRFAKIICGSEKEVLKLPDLSNLGPEALDINHDEFRKILNRKRGKIKKVLMDQSVVAGIGNIYSDEILYSARIHPLSLVEKLGDKDIHKLYLAMSTILSKGIKLGGTSTDDFRGVNGQRGKYGGELVVYRKIGRKCPRGHEIKRIKINSRSAHFCSVCQRLIH